MENKERLLIQVTSNIVLEYWNLEYPWIFQGRCEQSIVRDELVIQER